MPAISAFVRVCFVCVCVYVCVWEGGYIFIRTHTVWGSSLFWIGIGLVDWSSIGNGLQDWSRIGDSIQVQNCDFIQILGKYIVICNGFAVNVWIRYGSVYWVYPYMDL